MEKQLAKKIISGLNGFIAIIYYYFATIVLLDFVSYISRIEDGGIVVNTAFKNIQFIQIFELFGIGTIFLIFAILIYKYADKILD
ncbi:MAG: hypothetical protein KAS30_02655 [Candidatus Diapherotrites archaeon]|nr:hypothetical protein [Candidatus Diapherotrites archaeon]